MKTNSLGALSVGWWPSIGHDAAMVADERCTVGDVLGPPSGHVRQRRPRRCYAESVSDFLWLHEGSYTVGAAQGHRLAVGELYAGSAG
jgi:hypothetical protein